MKPIFLALLLIASPAVAEPVSSADESALRALAHEADVAWNEKDAARMAAVYTDGASLRFSGGAAIDGREAIRANFERNFLGRQGTMRHITQLDRAELIEPNLVLSDAGVRVEQLQADGSWKLMRTFRNVSLSRREGSTWKLQFVRAFQVPNPS